MSSQDPFDESGPFENKLGPALRRAGDTFEPADSEALVDGGLTRGRRRVVRRRTAAVTGSVLALALVGVGGAYGSGVLGDSGSGKSSVAGPKDPAPATAPPGRADPGKSGQELVSILRGLLAPGKLTPSSVTGVGGADLAHVTGILDDGKGKAEVSVALYRAGAQDLSSCPVNGPSKDQSCVSTELAGGDQLTVFQGYEYPDRREETRSWRAVLRTKTGLVIDFTEYNAPAEKGAKVSRAVPPLNPKQLRDLVTSGAWAGPLADLAKEPQPASKWKDGAPKGDPGAAPDGGNINKTFASLLPKGLKIIESGEPDSGYTYVVVDDGRGPTRVEINVQPGMNDVAGELFGEGTTELPGGVRLNTAKQPGEKGGVGMVMWQADTIRPDGLRVVVFETNGADQHGPASREEPALTIGQLAKIATSSKWLTFG